MRKRKNNQNNMKKQKCITHKPMSNREQIEKTISKTEMQAHTTKLNSATQDITKATRSMVDNKATEHGRQESHD